MTVVGHAIRYDHKTNPWLAGMLARKPKKVVTVALANRTARKVWTLTTMQETYRVRTALPLSCSRGSVPRASP